MEELIKGHYYLTYDEIITKAQMIQPHFAADLAQFAIYDTWFTVEVNMQLVSGIHKGLNDFPERSPDKQIHQIKGLLIHQLADARHCYEKLKYYVDKVFMDETAIKKTFGCSNFKLARGSVKKMIPLLNLALEAISKEDYRARLESAYMPPELPMELSTIIAALIADYAELKKLKKQQVLITRERIDLLNSLWDILSKICDDATIIFTHDPARIAIYELYDLEGSDADQVELAHIK